MSRNAPLWVKALFVVIMIIGILFYPLLKGGDCEDRENG
jgi:hypothetical protein